MSLPDLNLIKKVLIIRLSSIGDVVHALPVASALGKAHPHLQITWLVEEMSAPIVVGHKYLHEVIVIPRGRWKANRGSSQTWREYLSLLSKLRHERFDLSIDLQGYSKSAIFAAAASAKHRLGWQYLKDGAAIVSQPAPKRAASRHRVEYYLDTLAALGVDTSNPTFDLYIPSEAHEKIASLLTKHLLVDKPFIAINPATGDKFRRWGSDQFVDLAVGLAEKLGTRSVFLGSNKDQGLCESITSRANVLIETSMQTVSVAGETDLKSLAALLTKAKLHVSGDTGSLHIAAALGTHVVGLYGPTDPVYAGPFGQLERCFSGYSRCSSSCMKGRCSQMRNIDSDEIAPCLLSTSSAQVLLLIDRLIHG